MQFSCQRKGDGTDSFAKIWLRVDSPVLATELKTLAHDLLVVALEFELRNRIDLPQVGERLQMGELLLVRQFDITQ